MVQRILRDMNVLQKGCLFPLLFCAFVFRGESQVELCVDESLVDPGAICPTVFDPVCGCNGMTYGNSCYAMYLGGVVSWTQGECDDNGGQGAPDECPTDINADGTTNVVDLLLLLGEFASPCE